MNVLTLKIPEELDAALRAASRLRGVSKSALVREALEQSLHLQAERAGTAERWVAQWRGRLSARGQAEPAAQPKRQRAQKDERLAHILAKHLR